MLFLKTTILQQKCKFEYGYKFNESRMSRQSILLPIDEHGHPHWEYMDAFMRSAESKQIMKYLKHIEASASRAS